MLGFFKMQGVQLSAAVMAGAIMGSSPAHATTGGGSDFSTIAENIVTSIQDLPSLITGLAYLVGIVLAVLGILKIKDHVENPNNAPLKEGAIRIAAGGALFALPIITDAMLSTIGTGTGVSTPTMNSITFN